MVICIVEDDRHINEVISEYLKDAGIEVLSFFAGDKAGEAIPDIKEIDLFILDIMLPGVSGLDLLNMIRKNGVHGDKPILMLTALQDEPTQLTSFEALADDYVTKPFSPKVLVKRVESLLRRAGRWKNIIKTGSIQLNLDCYEAFENGVKIPFTLKEYELLKYLMENNTKVLSRQQLLNAVWGYDYFGDERIVDVHIKNIRKKLHANAINTVKGVGYKFHPTIGDDEE